MTATALAQLPLIDWNDAPLLDEFDAVSRRPVRPNLRLVQPATRPIGVPRDLALVEVHRRRRFLALLAATLVVLFVSKLVGVSLTSFGPEASVASDPAMPVVHVVVPGDSYGSIAAALSLPEPAQAAEQLRVANGGGELVVGQRLVLSGDQLQALRSAS